MFSTPRSRVANSWQRFLVLSLGSVLAVGVGVSVAQNPALRKVTSHPTAKPADKAENRPTDRYAVMQQGPAPLNKGIRQNSSQASAAGITVPVDISGTESWDALSDVSNTVLVIDVAALAGLGSGNSATIAGVGWDATIDTLTAPAVGVSWLSEAQMYFDDNVAPDLSGLFLSIGFGDGFAGIATYSSGGILDLSDNGIPDIVLPDGLLRLEFFEGFDDTDDAIDAIYTATSTITLDVLDPGSGACCEDATASCVGTTDQGTCEATSGQSWYLGEDCAAFTCPPPPADYIMDGTPVSTCSGTFADSGDTDGDYGVSENIVQTFTPSIAGQALEFNFTSFDVEAGWDVLNIYNGNSTAAPLIGAFDSSNPPGTITSGAADGSLTFEFISDSSVVFSGWIATISCVTPPSGGACCDAVGGCADVADSASCSGSYAGNGTDCASFTCPSPGDDCGNPLAVDLDTQLPFVDSGQTTCGRGDSNDTSCMGLYDGGEDIIYELTLTSDKCVNIVMTSDTSYTGIGIDSACPLGDPCIAEEGSSANDESLLLVNLTAGTYYLMLDTWPAPDCINSFDLSITECPSGGACCHEDGTCDDVAGAGGCVAAGDTYGGDGTSCGSFTCPPGNDLCDNAIKISSVPYADNGVDMPGATDDANVDPSCDSSFSCDTGPANNGVWYTYTPGQSCTATIDQTGIDASTSIWSGVDCNSLTQLTCSDPDPFEFDMSAGQEYWILVSNWSCSSEPSSAMDFTFDCVPLPTGACCTQGSGVCDCTEVAGVDCAGTYRGDGTTCNDDPDPCDCNSNGTCDPGDLIAGSSDDYGATALALAIPDATVPGIDHIINVPTGGTINDLNVEVDITHTWTGDLCVSLTHPSGSPTVQLIQRPGSDNICDGLGCVSGCGCDSGNLIAVLDDEAGEAADTTCPPEGNLSPYAALSAFDGLDQAGDWVLSVNDNTSADTGTLNGWTLKFNALPATSEDCNGNGTPDECEGDCDGNGVPDSCDVDPSDPDGDTLVADDCNNNGLPDTCDIDSGSSDDCQGDNIPDECQLTSVPRSMGTVVQDGGFEGGSPNADWTEASVSFGTPLCTVALCGTGTGTGPNSGDWWAWFGGIAAAETGSVEQTVTIPGGTTTMEFYYENPASSGNGTDFVQATIDGNVVWSELEGNAAYLTYALVSVDISAYGDGGSHVLRFESTITGVPTGTNFFIDDIEILAPTGPPANDCNTNGVPDECDPAVCGDGCLTGGEGTPAEECDGALDAACPGECRLTCACPTCGDGIVDPGEDCDGGVCCSPSCTFEPSGTECDPGSGPCFPGVTCDGTSASCPAVVEITDCINDDGCCPAGCNNNNDTDCAAVCGNNIREATEVCDGTDDSACPGACKNDCSCPTCGDGIVNQVSEVCDGADDSACPGLCDSNCACPGSGGIPTASAWGLMVMALLLLAASKIYFGRREVTLG